MSSQDPNKFDERIFPAAPCVERYFPGFSIEEGRERLVRCIRRAAGPGLIIGATGTGKSMLLQVLAAQFSKRLDIALLSSAQLCTRRALLQAILFELGLPHGYVDEGQLRITLTQHLLHSERSPNGTLLLVDEAQSLPVHLLEEIRQLTNIVRNGKPRVRLVIAGLPGLEETLADPQLESFQQRVATRCYLAPLGIAETGQYIRAHFELAGVDASSCIGSEVQDAVYNATDGICRLVSQLCDHALLLAGEKRLGQLSVSLIQEAWADLQQLPVPVETEPAVLENGSVQDVVEFGELTAPDDDFGMPADSLSDQALQVTPLNVETLVTETDDPVQDETTDTSTGENSRRGPFDDQVPCLPDWQSGQGDVTERRQGSTPSFLKPATDVDSSELPSEALPIETGGQGMTMREDFISGVEVGGFAPVQEVTDNPFVEEFAEEEIVLEEFSTLGDAFSERTPRVVSLDDGLSSLVQDVLGIGSEHSTSQTMSSQKPDDLLHVPMPVSLPGGVTNDELPFPIAATIKPGLELPDNTLPGDDTELGEVADLRGLVTLKYPVTDPSHFVHQADEPSDALKFQQSAHGGQRQLDGTAELAVEPEMTDNILIVEDDPADSGQVESSVRRQEYGQLFTRLRNG